MILKYGHPCPKKAQLSPHNHREVVYGAREQLTPEEDNSPPLENQGTKSIQGIVDALLYYGRVADNKLLVGLSSIGSQQDAAPERTKEATNQLPDYCATCPANEIFYCSSDMVLCAHSNTGFHNKIKGHRRARAHILFSKMIPCPNVTDQFSLLPKLLNSSCPLHQKQN